MSARLLFGRRIRAQDLQVRWELDREAPFLCRYNYGYITSKKKENMEKNLILNMERHKWTLFLLLLLLNLSNITYMTRVNADANTYTYSDSGGEIGELANVDE